MLSSLSQVKRLLITASLGAFFIGCVGEADNQNDSSGGSQSPQTPDLLSFFAHYADDIILPNYQALNEKVAELASMEGALATYCSALESGGDIENSQQLAINSWAEAMSAWQRVNLHHLGPISASSNALRNRFSSYEDNNLARCGLDQAVVQHNTLDNFDFSNRSSNQRGFAAIEYLLAEESLLQNCPSQVTETLDWDERPALERQQLRCNYALALAQDMAEASDDLLTAWQPNGGNFRQFFISPDNHAENLKALSDALFYVDITIKDKKLKFPLKLESSNPRSDCQEISCPEALESPFSQTSLDNIQVNLASFRSLLNSGDAIGFDDFFTNAGLPNLLQDFNRNIDAAIALASSSELSLAQQLALLTTDENARVECDNTFANPEGLAENADLTACAIAGFVKRLSDDLKVGFVTALNVDLPRRAQSDND